MQLVAINEVVTLVKWDGDGAKALCEELSSALQLNYAFANVIDSLEITGSGTNAVASTGAIQLYIDEATYIQLDCPRSAYNTDTSKVSPRICVVTPQGTYVLKNNYSTYYQSAPTTYYQYAIWKTETDQIIVSFDQSTSMTNIAAESHGLSFMIGTATNQYSNQSYPTIYSFSQFDTFRADSPWSSTQINYFRSNIDVCNRSIMVNTKLRPLTAQNYMLLYSDMAVLAPVVSPNNHYIMDNILVSTIIPTCFSDTYSTITYRGHQYAQFGRYLLLDEDTSQQGE